MKLEGKTVVITGGARGIGEALVKRFLNEGAAGVVIGDRDATAVERLASRLGVVGIQVDVADEAGVDAFVDRAVTELERIDLCCCNAGVAVTGGLEAPDPIWQRVWDVNFMGHLHVARKVVPVMMAHGGGYFLQTASAAGLLSHFGSGPYAVSKYAAVAFAEWLAINYGDRGIGVSCLCPQGVDTAMIADDDGMGGYLQEHAISPDVVADAVIEGLAEERFLILPHPEVLTYFQRKAADYDRWLDGMRRFRERQVNPKGKD